MQKKSGIIKFLTLIRFRYFYPICIPGIWYEQLYTNLFQLSLSHWHSFVWILPYCTYLYSPRCKANWTSFNVIMTVQLDLMYFIISKSTTISHCYIANTTTVSGKPFISTTLMESTTPIITHFCSLAIATSEKKKKMSNKVLFPTKKHRILFIFVKNSRKK